MVTLLSPPKAPTGRPQDQDDLFNSPANDLIKNVKSGKGISTKLGKLTSNILKPVQALGDRPKTYQKLPLRDKQKAGDIEAATLKIKILDKAIDIVIDELNKLVEQAIKPNASAPWQKEFSPHILALAAIVNERNKLKSYLLIPIITRLTSMQDKLTKVQSCVQTHNTTLIQNYSTLLSQLISELKSTLTNPYDF